MEMVKDLEMDSGLVKGLDLAMGWGMDLARDLARG